MSKVMEDLLKETAVRTAIETARYYDIPDDRIEEDIMVKFNLTKTEASAYMLQKSA